jgi:hypothetical protein
MSRETRSHPLDFWFMNEKTPSKHKKANIFLVQRATNYIK